MNCTLLSKTTGPELDSYNMHSANLLISNDEVNYATAPMAVVSPVDYLHDEEALHTSFEQAISGRVSALQERLNHLSTNTAHPIAGRLYNTDSMLSAVLSLVQDGSDHEITTEPLPMDQTSAHSRYSSLLGSLRQRYTLIAATALTFSMLGFDLMGLLVLHMR